jgi:hypothetical protein
MWVGAGLALVGAALAVLARATGRRSALAEVVPVEPVGASRMQPADAA